MMEKILIICLFFLACNSFTVYENHGPMNFSNNSFDEHNTNNYGVTQNQEAQYQKAKSYNEQHSENDNEDESRGKGSSLYVKNNNGYINLGKMDKATQSIGTGMFNEGRGRFARESKEEKSRNFSHRDISSESLNKKEIQNESRIEETTNSIETANNIEIGDLNGKNEEVSGNLDETTAFNDETEFVDEITTISVANEIEEMQKSFAKTSSKSKKKIRKN